MTDNLDVLPSCLFCELWNKLSLIAGRQQLRSLKDVLAGMREECDLIIEMKVGAHGNHGHEQQRAAWASGDLMDQHGLKWGYSSESSPFCTVARLLFEAMTGRYDENIARACRVVARDRNAAGL